MQKNARKYPPVRPGQVAGPSREAPPETHVLVDYENVQPTEAQLRELIPTATHVWLFHGQHQKAARLNFAGFGDHLTLVPITHTGKNALDFHLSFYMGYIASRHPDAHFVVLSNDKGYGPMLAHASALGFDAQALGMPRGKAAAKVATKTPRGRSAPASKARAEAAPSSDAAPSSPTPVAPKAPAKPARKPAVKTARQTVRPAPEAPAPAEELVAKPAAKKTTRRKTAAMAEPTPTPVAKPGREKTKANSAPNTEAAAPASPAPKRSAKAAPKVRAEDAEPSAAAQRKLLATLRRMGDSLPTKLAPLQRYVASTLGEQSTPAQVDALLLALARAGHLSVSANGRVEYALS
ncbi:PIN domain-containing protein [Ideonella sp.]|uniref:PIN domain-containing protein n=1 Tax=Ideonella sp. TaxID=1929293 RepID=UPI0037BEA196